MPYKWIASFLLLTATVMADPSLQVSASRDRIYFGESVLLEVKAGGSAQPEMPDVSCIKNCKISFLGSRDISHQSISIINGQMRREGFTGRTFHYTVTPTQTGTLILGPLSVQIDGATLSHPGPAVTVTGVTEQDIVAIEVTPSRDAVLVDEPFDIRVAVRIKKLSGSYLNTDPLFPQDPPNLNLPFMSGETLDGLQGPDIRKTLNDLLIGRDQAGFTINDYTVQPDMLDFGSMFNMQNTPARFKFTRKSLDINNIAYWEYSFSLRYTPQSEANFTFGPVLFKGRVPTAVQQNGTAESLDLFAVGAAAIVRVVPPPESNRPDCYIGAIGPTLTVESSLDAQTCNVGDPLSLTLSISGPVQIKNLYPPKLGLQSNLVSRFDIYDDTVKTSRENVITKYTYILRPRKAGVYELPPICAAYYDTSNRQYKIVSTAPVPLKVRQATEITASQVIGGSTNQAVLNHLRIQADMSPAGIRMTPNGSITTPLINNAGLWVWFAFLAPVAFIGAWGARTLYRGRGDLAKAMRRRSAMSEAKTILREGSPQTASKAFQLYLEQRLNIPASSITPSEARLLLIDHNVPSDIAAAFASAMQYYVDVSFTAQSKASDSHTETIDTAITAICDVERCLFHKSPYSRKSILIILLLWPPFLASELLAAADPEREFIWNEANAAMASAQTPVDFLNAAITYQKLVDIGVRNADLFFNQGTALLLANKPSDAAQVLLRSERYAGTRADIRRNLYIAYGKAAGLKAPFTPWSRIVLFWHYGWSCSARAAMTAIAFALIWGIAISRLMGWRKGTGTLVWLTIIVFIVMGTSLLTTITQEHRARSPLSLRPAPITMQ